VGLRRLLRVLVAVVITTTLVACGGSSDDVESVVLDEPGEYQQPTIALNDDLQGALIETAVLLDADDQEVDLADLIGQPLVINFWFSACPPCKREMPALQTVSETYADAVRFIGVNSVDSRERMLDFAEEMGVSYELLRDPNSDMLVSNGIAAFPTTLFVDSNGAVVKQVAGEVTVELLTSTIEDLLA
jgi:thiol-disulfide isomerase/thioredoxin